MYILVKIPDFGHFISLDRMNSVFHLINTIFFICGCWLLSEKFSFCPKNNGFARVWWVAAPPTPLARTPISLLKSYI